jgi:hypothetical protein
VVAGTAEAELGMQADSLTPGMVSRDANIANAGRNAATIVVGVLLSAAVWSAILKLRRMDLQFRL